MADIVDRLHDFENEGLTSSDRFHLRNDAAAEIERLRALVLDACEVFDRYDLPEHAFHYRRDILGLEQAKKIARESWLPIQTTGKR